MIYRQAIFSQLVEDLKDKRHTILVGARQVGKTTLAKQLGDYLKKEGRAVTYLTLEDPIILFQLNQHPEKLLEYLGPLSITHYVIIDEVQYLNDPTNFLKLLFDKYAPQLKVIATGSSAFYIDRTFKDSLAGRKKIIEIFPLNFVEYLYFKNQEELTQSYLRLRESPDSKSPDEMILRTYFSEYLRFGGYPSVVLADTKEQKMEMLAELANSYVKKDILEAGIKSDFKVFQLMSLLSHQVGSLLNHNELGNTLKLSSATVENYVYLLRKSYHLSLVSPKFGNIRKELTKMPKVYFNDLGLRNHFCRNFELIENRPDKGALLENYAFLRLKELYGRDYLHFWRTTDGNEVDFVTENPLGSYEVKFQQQEFKPNKYKKFIESYPEYNLRSLSYDTQNSESDIFRL